MHRFNTARLEELENNAKTQKKSSFVWGTFVGLVLTNAIWFGLDFYQAPTIVYSHTHDGPRNQRCGSTFYVKGATFQIPYEEDSHLSRSIEGPQTFKDMIDGALDDFERYKFFEQNNQSDDFPIKAIEIKVWK